MSPWQRLCCCTRGDTARSLSPSLAGGSDGSAAPPEPVQHADKPLAELLAELAALGAGEPQGAGLAACLQPPGRRNAPVPPGTPAPLHLCSLLHPSALGWAPREKGRSCGSPNTSAARGSPRGTPLAWSCRSSCSPCPEVSPGFRQRHGAEQGSPGGAAISGLPFAQQQCWKQLRGSETQLLWVETVRRSQASNR